MITYIRRCEVGRVSRFENHEVTRMCRRPYEYGHFRKLRYDLNLDFEAVNILQPPCQYQVFEMSLHEYIWWLLSGYLDPKTLITTCVFIA